MSDFPNLLEKACKCELLTSNEIKKICNQVTELFMRENNIVQVSSPVAVAGDIHGQFWDLQELFKHSGNPKNQKYIFLGDIVDRGHHSVESITQLLLYKIIFPINMILLRGNHESESTTQKYGFYKEICEKYPNTDLYSYFCQVKPLISLYFIKYVKIYR